MSKKEKQIAKKVPPRAPLKPLVNVPWYKDLIYVQLILGGIAFLFYANSILNEYALDDIISITGNSFTKKGFAGIPDIFSKDSMYGFIGGASQLSGGRWRPLALISFAIEWQLFGESPHISHFINVVLYAVIAILLFRFLHKYIFKNNLIASAIATLLFVIHPVHTEVVANIKSRDELLSMCFLLVTMLYALDYFYGSKKILKLFVALLFYFFALLSKENGLTFILIMPMLCFIVSKQTIQKVIGKAIPFIVVAVLYMLLRYKVIGYVHHEITEVMNAPFLYATPMQTLATKIYILLLYIKLLFFPYPLSYDYSYNQIPYVDFGNIWVIISILVYGSLIVYAVLNILKKDILSFGILFYLFSIFIVSNLLVDVGGTMGERFLFQPSVGFSICITVLLMKLSERVSLPTRKIIAVALFSVLLVITGYETWTRNAIWKDEKSLFVKDVYTCPNSARTNNGAGTSFIFLADDAKADTLRRNALLDSAVVHLRKSIEIHSKYVDPWLNLGVVYNRKGDAAKAEEAWNEARKRDPHHPKLVQEYDPILATIFFAKGNDAAKKNDYAACLALFNKAARYNPASPEIWYNLGGAYFQSGKYDSAQIAFTKCLQIQPNNDRAQLGMRAAQEKIKNGK